MPLIPRSEMEERLQEGRSVLIPGYGLVDRPEKLPTEAALAAASGDTAQQASVQQQLLQRMSDLQAQLALLQPAPAPENPPADPEPDPGKLASEEPASPAPAADDPPAEAAVPLEDPTEEPARRRFRR
jgi:hypothetical protein